jgi:hypothetical protein
MSAEEHQDLRAGFAERWWYKANHPGQRCAHFNTIAVSFRAR